jgi:hypothetical protein
MFDQEQIIEILPGASNTLSLWHDESEARDLTANQ